MSDEEFKEYIKHNKPVNIIIGLFGAQFGFEIEFNNGDKIMIKAEPETDYDPSFLSFDLTPKQ